MKTWMSWNKTTPISWSWRGLCCSLLSSSLPLSFFLLFVMLLLWMPFPHEKNSWVAICSYVRYIRQHILAFLSLFIQYLSAKIIGTITLCAVKKFKNDELCLLRIFVRWNFWWSSWSSHLYSSATGNLVRSWPVHIFMINNKSWEFNRKSHAFN